MVGAEGRLQLVPLGGPVPNHRNPLSALGGTREGLPPHPRSRLPGEGPAGPGTGVQLQRRVVADLLSRADRPGLQDVLHQVTIATDDVQRVNNRLPGLIWRGGGVRTALQGWTSVCGGGGGLGKRPLTFLSLHAGVGEEPGAGRGEDGRHAELSSAGLAGGDLGGRLGLASGGQKRQMVRAGGTGPAASEASEVPAWFQTQSQRTEDYWFLSLHKKSQCGR